MKELYVAVSGAVSREKQMALIANNLANVNTVGFKHQTGIFEVRPPDTDFEVLEASADEALNLPAVAQLLEGDRNYVRMAESYTDFSQGNLRATDNPFDMALESWGQADGTPFFRVETADGVAYTRSGNFALNADGELTTKAGLRVLDVGGQPIGIGENRTISVLDKGQVMADGEELGQIGVTIFAEPQALERVGQGLYSDRQGQVQGRDLQEDDQVVVRPGFLEMSNINAVDELVRMIDTQRAYGAFEKAIQTMDDASGRLITSAMNQ